MIHEIEGGTRPLSDDNLLALLAAYSGPIVSIVPTVSPALNQTAGETM